MRLSLLVSVHSLRKVVLKSSFVLFGAQPISRDRSALVLEFEANPNSTTSISVAKEVIVLKDSEYFDINLTKDSEYRHIYQIRQNSCTYIACRCFIGLETR